MHNYSSRKMKIILIFVLTIKNTANYYNTNGLYLTDISART